MWTAEEAQRCWSKGGAEPERGAERQPHAAGVARPSLPSLPRGYGCCRGSEGSHAGTPHAVSVPALLSGASACWCRCCSRTGSGFFPSRWAWPQNLSSQHFRLGLFSLLSAGRCGFETSRAGRGIAEHRTAGVFLERAWT